MKFFLAGTGFGSLALTIASIAWLYRFLQRPSW